MKKMRKKSFPLAYLPGAVGCGGKRNTKSAAAFLCALAFLSQMALFETGHALIFGGLQAQAAVSDDFPLQTASAEQPAKIIQNPKILLAEEPGRKELLTEEPSPEEPAFQLYARAAVLMDADSGRVLYEKEGSTRLPNASTTKILTAILTIESGKMEETATVSDYGASQPKVRLGMQAGDTFLIRDLLYYQLLESHNDSAVVIAEHIGGSVEGFAAMMNEKAREIGCTDTYFITPNGLDAQDETGVHGTTARDLALMLSYCLKNETFLEITRTSAYSFSNTGGSRQYACSNHNSFLSMMEGALTGKTGFTGNAGYCYVGALRQGERTFVVALLACGWPNNKSYKWADTRELMSYGLSQYRYEEVFEHEKELSDILVEGARPRDWKLYQKTYVKPLIADSQLKVLKKDSEEITVAYDVPKSLTAPVKSGTQIGTASYFLEEQCIGTYPITVEENVERMEGDWYFQYIMQNFFLPG